MVKVKKMQGNAIEYGYMHHGRGWYFLKGLIALILSIGLIFNRINLKLTQIIAVVFMFFEINHPFLSSQAMYK